MIIVYTTAQPCTSSISPPLAEYKRVEANQVFLRMQMDGRIIL